MDVEFVQSPSKFFFTKYLNISLKPMCAALLPRHLAKKTKLKPYRQSEETSVCVLQDTFCSHDEFPLRRAAASISVFPRELPPGMRGQSAASCQPRNVTSPQTHTHARARPPRPCPGVNAHNLLTSMSPRTHARIQNERSEGVSPLRLCACVFSSVFWVQRLAKKMWSVCRRACVSVMRRVMRRLSWLVAAKQAALRPASRCPRAHQGG